MSGGAVAGVKWLVGGGCRRADGQRRHAVRETVDGRQRSAPRVGPRAALLGDDRRRLVNAHLLVRVGRLVHFVPEPADTQAATVQIADPAANRMFRN